MKIANLELHTGDHSPWQLTKDIDQILSEVQERLLAALRSNVSRPMVYNIQITAKEKE